MSTEGEEFPFFRGQVGVYYFYYEKNAGFITFNLISAKTVKNRSCVSKNSNCILFISAIN
jgi:hypothetical protein